MIYFDNASTTKIDPRVLETYNNLLTTYFANPNGTHLLAREVNRLQDKARSEILKLFNYPNGKVIFTSSATEANNLALIGLYLNYKNRGNEIIMSPYEHPSVRNVINYLQEQHGAVIKILRLDTNGSVDLNHLANLVNKNTVLVSIMAVNNEVGNINDINAIKEVLKPYPKIIFHSDVTQAVGKVKLPYDKVDAFTFSSHKINGLKGSGALVLRANLNPHPIILGGAQEDGCRAGTSNAPTNILLAKTLRFSLEEQEARGKKVYDLSNYLRSLISGRKDLFYLVSPANSAYIVNFALLTTKASIVLNGLENLDIFVGTTSSCSAKLDEPSHSVLAITNDKKMAENSLRVSFSHENTRAEIDTFFNALLDLVLGGKNE